MTIQDVLQAITVLNRNLDEAEELVIEAERSE